MITNSGRIYNFHLMIEVRSWEKVTDVHARVTINLKKFLR
jgi:hypothetical protein